MGLPQPTPEVGIKLASLAVHLQEATGPNAHPFDQVAVEGLLSDSEVKDYMEELRGMALLPVTR